MSSRSTSNRSMPARSFLGFLSLMLTFATAVLASPPLVSLGVERDIPNHRFIWSIDVSPDGKSVYQTGPRTLMHFEREASSGDLTFVRAYYNPVGSSQFLGLMDSQEVKVSPSGEYVFVTSPGDALFSGNGQHSVTVFVRNVEDGTLTFLETLREGLTENNSVRRTALAISEEGHHLYLTGAGSTALTLIEQLPDGRLQVRERYSANGRHESIAISADGNFVYLGRSPLESAEIRVYRRNQGSGKLESVTRQALSFEGKDLTQLEQLVASPDHRHLYALACVTCDPENLLGLQVVTFERQDDGRLTILDVPPATNSAHHLQFGPEGRFAYLNRMGDTLSLFTRDPQSGLLEFIEDAVMETRTRSFRSRFAISPDGAHLYAGSFDGLTVARFDRDPVTGSLRELEEDAPTRSGLRGFGSPHALLPSPDGRFLYTSSQVPDVLAAIETPAGEIGETAHIYLKDWNVETGLSSFDQAVMSRDGRHLYAEADDRMAIFLRRDPSTGELARVSNEETLDTFGLALSPDEKHLLSTGLFGMNLRVADVAFILHDRDPADGTLTNRRTLTNVQGDNGFLLLGTDLDFSPDGRFAYAPIAGPNFSLAGLAIVRVEPENATEPLAVVGIQTDIRRRDRNESGTLRTVISDDGRHLYLSNHLDQSLRVYRRNLDDGSLLLTATYLQGEEGVDGLVQNTDLVLHPRGRLLVLTDRGSNALTVFERDPTTGLLSFRGVLRHTDGVEGLDLPTTLTFSPDGHHLYVASDQLGTLATFTTKCTDSNTVLCLQKGRFRVEVHWRDFEDLTGDGIAVRERADDSGLFWFFNANNWEMLVKVLDGCAINQNFWAFSAATTNVEYRLQITDTETGRVRFYDNPLGISASAVTDTEAFACSE